MAQSGIGQRRLVHSDNSRDARRWQVEENCDEGYEKAQWQWPQTTTEVDEANAATLLKLVDTLEDDDDVQTVWGNYEVSDAVMEKLG